MADEVQFQSPTTGKVQAIPAEHWDEAIKAGYKPVSHTIMYDTSGNRGMVPNSQIAEYGRQGYTVTPETQFEKERKGGTGAIGALESMIPADPTEGRSITDPRSWYNPDTAKFNPTGPGTAYNDLTRKLPEDLPTDALVTTPGQKAGPINHVIGRGIYRTASVFSPNNAEASEEAASHGDTANVATQAIVPAAMTIAAPLMNEALRPTNNFLASKLRRPATPYQAEAGVPGSVKPILPEMLQKYTIPDWLIPKGEVGTPTNPGPFSRIPNRLSTALRSDPFAPPPTEAPVVAESSFSPYERPVTSGQEPLVVLPDEAASLDQLQNIAAQRAKERGMQYAGGVRTAGKNKVANRLFPIRTDR